MRILILAPIQNNRISVPLVQEEVAKCSNKNRCDMNMRLNDMRLNQKVTQVHSNHEETNQLGLPNPEKVLLDE